jgi:hypothetical protein
VVELESFDEKSCSDQSATSHRRAPVAKLGLIPGGGVAYRITTLPELCEE